MAPGLVIFDCDGVLVDSEGISMRTLTSAIAAAGGTLALHEVDATFTGVSLAAIEAGVAAHLGRPAPPGWMDAWLAVRAEAFERELQPVPGAAEAVEGVRALGCATCVASQGSVAKMDLTLRVTGMQACFPRERIFSGTMVEHGKPAPDLYLLAAAECGFAPDDCVVIEDSVTGVTAARAAGMRTLGYVANGAADGPLARRLAALGAELVHDMREVPRRVART
jgi:HAD superfamily hydrolase (TIGR01509 family)